MQTDDELVADLESKMLTEKQRLAKVFAELKEIARKMPPIVIDSLREPSSIKGVRADQFFYDDMDFMLSPINQLPKTDPIAWTVYNNKNRETWQPLNQPSPTSSSSTNASRPTAFVTIRSLVNFK